MGFVEILIVAAVTFGVCWLVDRGFTKIFRSKKQHISGLSVRLNKRYATIGIILVALGTAALFAGINGAKALIFGGPVVLLLGIGLITYYLTFGVFYDSDSFVLTTFGNRSVTYSYRQIRGQLLYNASGNIIIELHMTDGRSVSLQSTMVGVYPFLDTAFSGWCRQTGRREADCDFHDPDNSIWFPNMEGK